MPDAVPEPTSTPRPTAPPPEDRARRQHVNLMREHPTDTPSADHAGEQPAKPRLDPFNGANGHRFATQTEKPSSAEPRPELRDSFGKLPTLGDYPPYAAADQKLGQLQGIVTQRQQAVDRLVSELVELEDTPAPEQHLAEALALIGENSAAEELNRRSHAVEKRKRTEQELAVARRDLAIGRKAVELQHGIRESLRLDASRHCAKKVAPLVRELMAQLNAAMIDAVEVGRRFARIDRHFHANEIAQLYGRPGFPVKQVHAGNYLLEAKLTQVGPERG